MLAVDVQQSTIEKALVFYQSHLESVREQQENDLPRNGKARATAEDLAKGRAFDEQLQAIAGLLNSTSKDPEQTAQEAKIPPKDPLPHHQTLKIFDEFDAEPYINPFTGQLIAPETGFEAGPSIAHISVNPSYLKRHEPVVLDDNPRRQTAAVFQHGGPSWEQPMPKQSQQSLIRPPQRFISPQQASNDPRQEAPTPEGLTYADVSAHNIKRDLYRDIYNNVYDVSSFVDEFP